MLNSKFSQFITLASLASLLIGCATNFGQKSKLHKTENILSLDGEAVTKENFVYLYDKNYSNDSAFYSKESVDDYLDLFINFKLKVAEAITLGYDTLPAFQNEYKMYLNQLEEPYLTESVFNDSLVKEAYDRQKIEVRASHILITAKKDASPEDTLKAYTTAINLLEEIKEGKNFEQVAFTSSQDPSAKQNKGDLGYFTSLQMVYPFEDAAFKAKIGDVVGPVRTDFGYHLIYVKDKRERYGTLQVQHIMIKSTKKDKAENQEIAQRKINAIYDSLQLGGDWAAMCSNFSDDKRSSSKEGILPPVSEVRFPKEFMEGVYSLDSIGSISNPVRTDFGWHIIRLYQKKPVMEYEVLYPTLVKKVKKDSRSSTSRQHFIQKLKNDNEYTINEENKSIAFSLIDSTRLKGQWKVPEDLSVKNAKKVIFTLATRKVTVNDFFDYVSTTQKSSKNDNLENLLNSDFDSFSNIILLEEEKKNLADKYPEYKHLAQEYKDGLLLFRVMEDCVWNKASSDITALKTYHNQHRKDYMWDTRADVEVYNTGSKDLENETLLMLDSGYFRVFPTEVSTINYKRNSSYLYKSRIKDLQKVADVLNTEINLFIVINVEYDKKEGSVLRKKRFNNIKNQLVKKGVNINRIKSHFEEGVNGVVDLKYFTTEVTKFINTKNSEHNLAIQYTDGIFTENSLPYKKNIEMKVGRYIFEENNRFIIVNVKEILPTAPKTFNESKGNVIADYQEYLEKEWVKSLHTKHQVVVDSTVLQSLYVQDKTL
ncbi:peptidylprolyl isomerase [Flammeovirga kamogawensis]|uniref:Peptidylprolyl isomerase n=1 Tax=Flammeovirga kamogawensis TaxID=373891 RepID=A0ABX8GW08_9BACT|nr:peptidylprolyl isomerase [Flammeovirga kamogawensis]MBB6461566.1 peptidyl-prolyl cis-trans isomerase SurA [Flammeovirga kamogawensis]QWG07502.1 peptidylprolyl isomerase [Flammeovirga kamogawensis]TRX69315.1 hypothetical protein EO216_14725 [Flammeovirga kamogawensis]